MQQTSAKTEMEKTMLKMQVLVEEKATTKILDMFEIPVNTKAKTPIENTFSKFWRFWSKHTFSYDNNKLENVILQVEFIDD